MRRDMEDRLNLFIENIKILNSIKGIKLTTTNILIKCAALNLTIKNKIAEKDKIEKTIKIIKENTSVFSNFRSINILNLAINIYEEEDIKDALEDINLICKELKKELFANQYLVLAAQIIYFAREKKSVTSSIIDSRRAYGYMKKNHMFLTGQANICAAAIIATTSQNLNETFRDIEDCYTLLKAAGFQKGNDLQSLCHLLSVINKTSREKCKMVAKMNNTLEECKAPLRWSATPLLGITPFVCDDYKEFGEEVKKVSERLKKVSGFGTFSMWYYVRNMIAASIVASVYAKECIHKDNMINLTNNTSINIVVASQRDVITAVTASIVSGIFISSN